MSKKSLINREKKRIGLYKKYFKKINELKTKIKLCQDFKTKWKLLLDLQAFPRNASLIRQRNRCFITGRPRGFLRRFGVCRIKLRELASQGNIPGLLKSSW